MRRACLIILRSTQRRARARARKNAPLSLSSEAATSRRRRRRRHRPLSVFRVTGEIGMLARTAGLRIPDEKPSGSCTYPGCTCTSRAALL